MIRIWTGHGFVYTARTGARVRHMGKRVLGCPSEAPRNKAWSVSLSH